MTRAEQIVERVDALHADGMTKMDAFRKIGADWGLVPSGVRGTYYSEVYRQRLAAYPWNVAWREGTPGLYNGAEHDPFARELFDAFPDAVIRGGVWAGGTLGREVKLPEDQYDRAADWLRARIGASEKQDTWHSGHRCGSHVLVFRSGEDGYNAPTPHHVNLIRHGNRKYRYTLVGWMR